MTSSLTFFMEVWPVPYFCDDLKKFCVDEAWHFGYTANRMRQANLRLNFPVDKTGD